MDGQEPRHQQQDLDDVSDIQKDAEAWSLPRGPVLPGPSLDEWPEEEPYFGEELEGIERQPAA